MLSKLVSISCAVFLSSAAYAELPKTSPTAKMNLNNEMVHAIQSSQIKRAQVLQKQGVSIDALDFSGQTGLMRLAEDGDLPAIEETLKAGANLNAQNADGETAIWYAVYNGHEDLALNLMKKGAKVDQIDKSTKTCLIHHAVEGAMPLLVKELIRQTPQCLNQKNKEGMTPAALAQDLRNDDITKLFGLKPKLKSK